jgi:KDO2-lipid IV(A) lauroyltransferase
MRITQRVLRWWIYRSLTLTIFISRLIPFPAGIKLGGLLGRIAYYLLPRERRLALAHLDLAFGQESSAKKLKTIAKKSFENLGKNFFELLNLSKIIDNFPNQVRIEGRQWLDQALNEGKGVLWVTGHIGNWELMAAVIARLGYPMNAVGRSVYDKRINALLLKLRSENKVNTIVRGEPSATNKILSCLQRNEILGILIDQDTDVSGVFVNFLGKAAHTPTGAAALALRLNCPVIAGFISRREDESHKILIHPPLKIIRTGKREDDIFRNTAMFTEIIERQIRADPSQWVWMHRRWRKRPGNFR